MNRYTVKLQILQENNEYDVEEDEERDITFYNHQSMPAINVRMLNYNKQTRIKDLKAIIYDEFISVTGTVVKISNIRNTESERTIKNNIKNAVKRTRKEVVVVKSIDGSLPKIRKNKIYQIT